MVFFLVCRTGTEKNIAIWTLISDGESESVTCRMNCWALILSTNLCDEMFHQSETCKYRTCFYYSRSWKRRQRGVQFTHKYSDTEWRLSAYERLRQKTEPGKKSRGAKGGKAGEEGRARAVFPHAAAVAWLSAALKITAFTLRLKNSRSDHLFRRKSSSSIVFPRPLRCSRPVTRLTLLASLASFHSSRMCEILCFWFTSLSVSLL